MADAPTSAALNTRRRRAMIACTNCRRRKIKCVTTEEPPRHPCERCTKRVLTCEYVAVEEPVTPESPRTALPSQYAPVNPGYNSPYAPSQSQYGPWNPPPQSQPANAGYPNHSTGYNPSHPYAPIQSPYVIPPAYPQYGFQQQFAPSPPTNQWAQGSIQQQPRCRVCGCASSPCYCYSKS